MATKSKTAHEHWGNTANKNGPAAPALAQNDWVFVPDIRTAIQTKANW
ncbi:hypothetical protein RFF05_10095 [Bengtsoniella intestinalis]